MWEGTQPNGSGQRKIALAFAAISLLATLPLAQNPGNTNSLVRIALAVALIDRGEVTIDAIGPKLLDHAYREGHYYCDKAPGVSFLAVPPIALVRGLGLDPYHTRPNTDLLTSLRALAFYVRIATLALLLPCFWLSMYLVFRIARELGASDRGAFVAALVYGLATPAFGLSTALFSHVVTGAGLVSAMALVLTLRNRGDGRLRRRSMALGLTAAATVTVEYSSVPALLVVAALFIASSFEGAEKWWRPRNFDRVSVAGLAFFIGLVPLLHYNQAAFGGPLKIGYSQLEGWEGMRTGFFGIGLPKLDALFGITFSSYRGLFWSSPVLLLTPVAFVVAWKQPPARAAVVASVAICACYLWINASYFYWHGGASTGPRHLAPCLPFLAIPMALLWDQGPRWRGVLLGLLALSVAISAASAMTGMFALETIRFPLREYVWARLVHGMWWPIDRYGFAFTPPALRRPFLFVSWSGVVIVVGLAWRWIPSRSGARASAE